MKWKLFIARIRFICCRARFPHRRFHCTGRDWLYAGALERMLSRGFDIPIGTTGPCLTPRRRSDWERGCG